MPLGRILIAAGILLILLGVVVLLLGRFHIRLGHLPGDVIWRDKNTTIYFPIVTCLLLSFLGSLLLWFLSRRP
jgi:Protein of unknown function (DUF2905)